MTEKQKQTRIAHLRRVLKGIEAKQEVLAAEKKITSSELGDLLSPFQLGDVIQWSKWNDRVIYKGVVLRVRIDRDFEEAQWLVRRIRKDGKLTRIFGELRPRDKPILVSRASDTPAAS